MNALRLILEAGNWYDEQTRSWILSAAERIWFSAFFQVGPYLVNQQTKEIISYEDEESIQERCKYVLENKMGGVMFWEYDSDPKGYLLNEIDRSLK